MLNRLKIGQKILLGIFIMLAIIGAVIIYTIFNINEIKIHSENLAEGHLPEIEIATELDHYINRIMFDIDHYISKEDEASYALLQEDIKTFESYLNSGEELAKKYDYLLNMEDEILELKRELGEFKVLIEKLRISILSINSANEIAAESALKIYDDINIYLANQQELLNTELANLASAAIIQSRVNKTKLINDTIDNLNLVRVANLKAQIADEMEILSSQYFIFDEMIKSIDDVLDISIVQKDIEQLNKMKEHTLDYRVAAELVVASNLDVNVLIGDMQNLSKQLESKVEIIIEGGTKLAKEISILNTENVQKASLVLIIGIIAATVIGLTVNLLIIRKIKSGLSEITKVSKELAIGKVDVEIEIDSKDEIGILANSMREMINSTRENASAIQSIADGDLSIEIQEKSEHDILAKNINKLASVVKNIIVDVESTNSNVTVGKVTYRSDSENYTGSWKVLLDMINNLSDSYVSYLDRVPTIISMFDTNLNVNYVNEAGLRATGKTLKEAIGIKYCDLFKTEDCNTAECACAKAMQTKTVQTRETIAKPNGVNMNISYNGVPLFKDGEVVGVIDVITDLTAVKEVTAKQEKQMNFQETQVKKLIGNLEDFSRGNLSVDFKQVNGDKDVKKIVDNFNDINNTLTETSVAIRSYVEESIRVLTAMAKKSLIENIQFEFSGDFRRMKDSIDVIIESFNEVLGEIGIASKEVASGSSLVADSSQELSNGSIQQAGAIQEITASILEVAEQTKINAVSAQKATELSNVAKLDAEDGNSRMTDMLNAMKDIEESSNNISKIIKVIDEIAFQTNILALNAAVEAARAGQHGKGFAVVAEEVRNLAGKSSDAAKETTLLIEDSIKKVVLGTTIAEETAKALNKIVAEVDEAADIVAEIAVASNEQAIAFDQVNDGINQISNVTQTIAATAQESASASDQMTSQAKILEEMVSEFVLTGIKTKSRKSIDNSIYGNKEVNGFELPNIDHFSFQSDSANTIDDEKLDINLDDIDFGKY